MKKILILSHTGSHSHFKIGSHHYANGLSKEFEVTYIGSPFTALHKLCRKDISGENKLDSEVITSKLSILTPITTKYNSLLVFMNKISSKILDREILSEKYDVVICDYPFFEPYLVLIDYKKLIYRPTDAYYHMAGNKVKFYEESIIKKSDKIIGTSKNVIDVMTTLYPDAMNNKDATFISNGYDHKKFLFSEHATENIRNGSVYIGSLDYRFDFDILRKLASANVNDSFDIYGPISEESLPLIESIKKENSNVKFMGSVSYEDVPDILSRYRIGMLLLNDSPSNEGRSPMKLWEYAATGLQIIYSRINVTEKYEFLHYYTESDVLKQYQKAKETTISASEISKIKKFSWENNINHMTKVIERLFHE